MIVVRGTYLAPIHCVDAIRTDHLAWVTPHIASGRVIAAGRNADATGSVFLFSGTDPDAALALLKEDPYVLGAVASYEVAGVFTPVVHADGFEPFVS